MKRQFYTKEVSMATENEALSQQSEKILF